MRIKKDRLETLRMIISSREMGSQEELLAALQEEGFKLTQATLSRDLKQLKVAKADADEAAHWPWPCGVLAGYTRTRLTHV